MLSIACLGTAIPRPAGAADGEPRRTLERATPALRELSTDRPDTTESPRTLNVGRLQLEMDVATYTRDKRDGVTTTEWAVAPAELRYALTSGLELGLFVAPYVRSTEQPRGARKQVWRGQGDTTVRAKLNVWGNDTDGSAGGMIVDVKLPTAVDGLGNDRVEPAVAFPFTSPLGAGWDASAMTSVMSAVTDRGRRPVWLNTLSFSRDVATDVGAYFELTSTAGDGAHACTFNTGLTRALGRDAQLDCGVAIGISRAAPDLKLFAGLARRF